MKFGILIDYYLFFFLNGSVGQEVEFMSLFFDFCLMMLIFYILDNEYLDDFKIELNMIELQYNQFV